MGLYISSLNSGSNGNVYYISNGLDAVLIDVGVPLRIVERRAKSIGVNCATVKAIFVTHEHGDHIKGLCAFAHKYQLPVFGNAATLSKCADLPESRKNHIHNNETVQVGGLSITAFSKIHDAVDPLSFIVEHNNVMVGVFTDIGRPCTSLHKWFPLCHAAFLESNYDAGMLEAGPYPWFLKQRITGGRGHLSNTEALAFYLQHRSTRLQHLILSHLSCKNNDPVLVQNLFAPHAGKTKISVASREAAYPLTYVGAPREVSFLKKTVDVLQLRMEF